MVTYHILVETTIRNEVVKLNKYLRPHEILTNSPLTLSYKITNIGNKIFPGGRIERIEVRFSPAIGYGWLTDLKIPQIPKEQIVTQSQSLMLQSLPGTCTFAFKILTKQKEEILYYRDRSGEARRDGYVSYVHSVVDRRQVEMIALLDQILNNLKKE